jgi:hypothetical protein
MGGVYAPEFLDAVTQMTLILVTDSTVYYAGGFESAHFLRQPTVRACVYRCACSGLSQSQICLSVSILTHPNRYTYP